MKRKLIIALALALILVPALSQAAQFHVLGPRALGMGGASVAAVNDSSAVYWNPAALADFRKLEIRVPVSAAVHDHQDLKNTWDRINEIYASMNPFLYPELEQLLLDLNKPGSTTALDASLGVFTSIPFSRSAIALSLVGIAYADLFPVIDTANLGLNIVNNNSAVTGIGIINIEPTFSFATSLGDKMFIGVNAKMISASTFVHSDYIRTGDYDTFLDNLDLSETSSEEASIDAGLLINLTKSFSVGAVGRYLNSPSFPVQGRVAQKDIAGNVTIPLTPETGEIELEPQIRAGVAWSPFKLMTFSADYDLSKNKTLTDTYEDQTFAVGGEITLPAEVFSFRGGVYKNTADSDANLVYTAGVGIRLFVLRVDVAGAYDFQEQEAQVSADLVLRF